METVYNVGLITKPSRMLRLVLSQPLHSASPQRFSAPFKPLFASLSRLFQRPRSLRSLSKDYTRL